MSTKFLYVLVLSCFPLSLAARSKSESSSTAAANLKRDVKSLSSLLAQRGYSTDILESLGQKLDGSEAPAELKTALNAAVDDLTNTVQPLIRAGFQSTQSALASAFDRVSNRISEVLTEKGVADDADQAWFDCVGEERSMLEHLEATAAELSDATAAALTPCGRRDELGSTPFTAPPLSLGSMTCDFSIPNSCSTEFQRVTTAVDAALSVLESDMNSSQDAYDQAESECNSANAHVDDLTSKRDTARSNYQSQQQECTQLHQTRRVSMCLFGSVLQSKCESVDAFQDLTGQVEGRGSEHSELDRQDEWKTVDVTICMLMKIVGGGAFDAQTLSECESGVNYETDVGRLDMFASQMETLTLTDVACGPTVSFVGETWDWPSGGDSTQYSVVDYHPAFDASNPLAPFDFCAPATTTAPVSSACDVDRESCECQQELDATFCDRCPPVGKDCGGCGQWCWDNVSS